MNKEISMSLRMLSVGFVCALTLALGSGCGMGLDAPPAGADTKASLETSRSELFGCASLLIQPYFGQHLIYDHFNSLPLFGEPGGVYWVPNTWGDGSRTYGYTSGDGSASISLRREGCTKHLRLSLHPDPTPNGGYSNADVLNFQNPGEHFGQQLPFKATYGHPVILTARIRWQGDYGADGSGQAVGTSGVAIWNHAYGNNAFSPLHYFGLSWSMKGSGAGVEGFGAVIVSDNFPIAFFQPPAGVDFKQWNRFKVIWYVDSQGQEFVSFWLNGKKWGTTTQLTSPTPSTGLALDLWNDNQLFSFETGLTYPPATTNQHFDVDFARIIK